MSHLNTLLQIMCYVHRKRSWAFLEIQFSYRARKNPWNIFAKKWILSNSSGFICLFFIRINFSKDIVPGFCSNVTKLRIWLHSLKKSFMENSVKHLSMTQLFCEKIYTSWKHQETVRNPAVSRGINFLQNSSNIDV